MGYRTIYRGVPDPPAPGIYLEVVSNFSPASGLYMIQLREIPPPYKMLADPFDLKPIIKEDHIKTSGQILVTKSKFSVVCFKEWKVHI